MTSLSTRNGGASLREATAWDRSTEVCRSEGTETSITPTRFSAWIDLAILGALTALLATVIIPSHWTSIWMDREFTGTVGSIANRLEPGVKLYADGGHIPVSPLPFLLMRLLTHGRATWLWESSLNFAFQALALLAVYLALRSFLRPPVPFLAVLTTIPLFFALPKTVLYDSMAQATVALLVLQASGYLGRRRTVHGPGPPFARYVRRRPWLLPLGGLALSSAVALLVKQSTGIGACLGLTAAICLCDRGSWTARLSRAAWYVVLTAIFAGALIGLLTPWVDGAGLIRDVFLTGSEPKGGIARMLANLGHSAAEIGWRALALLVPLGAFLAVAGRLCRTTRAAHRLSGGTAPGVTPAFIAVGSGLSITAVFALYKAGLWAHMTILARTPLLAPIPWTGFFLGVLLTFRCFAPRLLRDVSCLLRPRVFAAVFLIVVTAALFHSLSGDTFRWAYDNNPLIPVVYAAFFQVFLNVLGRIPGHGLRLALIAGVCFVVVPLRPSARLADQLLVCQRCTESWDEVRYLSGARLQPSADGMRRLVQVVRRSAGPGDQVLLLPNDPNVEAWFERGRPRLSSLMIFADQYWDRYVDADLAALRAQPPKVVVVGPVRCWRSFHWYFYRNVGAERLIDRVTSDLLPAHYGPCIAVPIVNRGKADRMDVYVRRD